MIGRHLGIDWGEVRIGLALSDPMGIIASPHDTLGRRNLEFDLDQLAKLVAEKEVMGFVVGRPRNTDGTEGPAVRMVEEFVESLVARCPLPVHWIDEAYTSIEADNMLREHSGDWRKRKPKLDMVAAQIILRIWLESQ